MTRFGWSFFGPLALLAVLTAGCGGSRKLQSVNVSPAAANAQSFPNGEVPFQATGTFSAPPSPVQLTSQEVQWCAGTSSGVCVGNINPGVTVDQDGVTRCNSGFVGTVTVLAGQSASMAMPDTGQPLKIFGTAQITCP